MKEILNVYVSFPFDEEVDKDLFEHYSPTTLLFAEVDVPLLENLVKDGIYHIVVTRVTK